MSENRRIRRFLLRKGVTKNRESFYVDNKGGEYPYEWLAKLGSFYNVIMGCFKNGFPIVVPKLRYIAWAFYPFFLIRKDLKVKDPIPILNHERIHIRQQRDIHITLSLPLLVLCCFAEWFAWFNTFYLLCSVPFIPTLLYGIEMIRSYRNLIKNSNGIYCDITFNKVRENTCFEREAISRSTNADYLFTRKFWAVLAYTGWRKFKNYNMK